MRALHGLTRPIAMRLLLGASLVLGVGSPMRGTVYVLSEDDAPLLAEASLLIEGTVEAIRTPSDGRFETDYEVAVVTAIKGAANGRVTVSVLGGGPEGGLRLEVPGAPRFAIGEQVLLFLGPRRPDGTHRLVQQALGAFHRLRVAGRDLAVRQLDDAAVLRPGGLERAAAPGARERDWSTFRSWLLARARGRAGTADYFVALAPAERGRLADAFTFLGSPKARWFVFERGSSVTIHGNASGQQQTNQDELASLQAALLAWNADSASRIDLRWGGTSTATATRTRDFQNVVVWNDPNGDIEGEFRCFGGGSQTIALGGYFAFDRQTPFTNGDGLSDGAGEIVEVFIIVNDGAGCILDGAGGRNGEEILAHELGHTLGFGHSSESGALMRATAYLDGRGARLDADDLAGARFLYPQQPGAASTIGFETGSLSVVEGSIVSVGIRRSNSNGAASVEVLTANGSALAGSDYQPLSTTVTWGAGETGIRLVSVAVIDDGVSEANEFFDVRLANVVGAALGNANLRIQVRDRPPAGSLAFSKGTITTGENAGFALLTVLRSNGSAGVVGVGYRTVAGSAGAGSDFVAAQGSLQWNDGDTSPRSINVPLVNDVLAESVESFSIELFSPTGGASLGPQSTVQITIADDDQPGMVAFGAPLGEVSEDGRRIALPVVRVGGVTGPISVDYATANLSARAGSDYTARSGTLSWAHGDGAIKTIVVPILQDQVVEGVERLRVRLTAPSGGATLQAPSAIEVLIADDDLAGTLGFLVDSMEVTEGEGVARVLVGRTDGAVGAVSVGIATAPGSARAGADYQHRTATLFWANGEVAAKAFEVSLLQDAAIEAAETFRILLSAPTGGALLGVPSELTVSLIDPDHGGEVRFRDGIVVGIEGELLEVAVERSGGLAGAVTARISAAEDAARVGQDFTTETSPVTLRWGSGQGGVRTVETMLIGDAVAEPLEAFSMHLDSVSGGALRGAQRAVKVLVRDDDLAAGAVRRLTGAGVVRPRLAISDQSTILVVAEQGSGASRRVVGLVLDATGVAQGAAFALGASSPDGGQHLPAVSAWGNGFWVSWIERAGNRDRLLARRLGPQGQLVGAPQVALDSATMIAAHALDVTNAGRATIALERAGAIEVLGLLPNGQLAAPLRRLGEGTAPALAIDGVSETVVVWGTADGVRGRRLRADLSLAGAARLLVPEAGLAGYDIAAWGAARLAILWTRDEGDLRVRRFLDEVPLGGPRALVGAGGASALAPALAADRLGNLALAWQASNGALRLRLLSADDAVLTPPLALAGATGDLPGALDVALGVGGSAAAVWDLRTPSGGATAVDMRTVSGSVATGLCPVTALCLNQGRFAVTASWTNGAGGRGAAVPVAIGDTTGYFWFLTEANVELLVKVLDGCPVNDRFWVFAGGLTNLEVELVVTDVLTGSSRAYHNPATTPFAPIGDTQAFATCP